MHTTETRARNRHAYDAPTRPRTALQSQAATAHSGQQPPQMHRTQVLFNASASSRRSITRGGEHRDFDLADRGERQQLLGFGRSGGDATVPLGPLLLAHGDSEPIQVRPVRTRVVPRQPVGLSSGVCCRCSSTPSVSPASSWSVWVSKLTPFGRTAAPLSPFHATRPLAWPPRVPSKVVPADRRSSAGASALGECADGFPIRLSRVGRASRMSPTCVRFLAFASRWKCRWLDLSSASALS